MEKHYQAALIVPARGERRAARPIESDTARQSLIDLELVLVQVLADRPLDNAARRFTAAADLANLCALR